MTTTVPDVFVQPLPDQEQTMPYDMIQFRGVPSISTICQRMSDVLRSMVRLTIRVQEETTYRLIASDEKNDIHFVFSFYTDLSSRVDKLDNLYMTIENHTGMPMLGERMFHQLYTMVRQRVSPHAFAIALSKKV